MATGHLSLVTFHLLDPLDFLGVQQLEGKLQEPASEFSCLHLKHLPLCFEVI